ncbi:hypothetical protein EMIHUDRAFT_243530 [Emiliania huxleyi CCMP1516]|uniref:SnoaL-like domain-containing protein n=2 Tax=Emiliania huxleyi TaxID=2903 RepID=A0A0D3J5F2_EMIH1|nr:hypothetical protein EMIHUDRAFT_243530 [Emiliania huxleyi CCMP1516]EOD18737.1 hypothetical protein EMIHUDRAFT_243530 [Emiliania huxleyi CCMP1516]|eukprot:XP_005771166.1 hypothetical protein EMIHUDRAFT_243530 [Emiliania huxleyi CCMP1516]
MLALLLSFSFTPIGRPPIVASRAGEAAATFPKFSVQKAHGVESAYQLALGTAIDTLRRDYPGLLTEEPDFSIFTEDVALFDPSGKRLQSIGQYEQVFRALRLLRKTTMVHSEVTYRLTVADSMIRVRWVAKLWMRPMVVVPGYKSEPPRLQLDGISEYELNDEGAIKLHRLSDIALTDEGAAVSAPLSFVWPVPELAVPELARPFFGQLKAALPHAARCGPIGGAARDADAASRAGAAGDGACETSFDCEAPMVCCDLMVTKVCCSSGIMVGQPRASLQEQLVAIPAIASE